jgi:hypothetical protein
MRPSWQIATKLRSLHARSRPSITTGPSESPAILPSPPATWGERGPWRSHDPKLPTVETAITVNPPVPAATSRTVCPTATPCRHQDQLGSSPSTVRTVRHASLIATGAARAAQRRPWNALPDADSSVLTRAF